MVKGYEWEKMKKEAIRERGYNVKRREENQMQQLWGSGLDENKIGKKLKRDPRTVLKHLILTHKADLRTILRPCLINNHLELPNRYEQAPLELDKQDWRLDPITWCHLCTPDLSPQSQGYWGGNFAKLKNKMQEIKFWEHHRDLWVEVNTLQNKYEEVVQNLSPKYMDVWDNIQRERNSCYPPSRTPEDPRPDWKDWIHGYDRRSAEEVINDLRRFIPNLDERFFKLEELLQQLNNDLD